MQYAYEIDDLYQELPQMLVSRFPFELVKGLERVLEIIKGKIVCKKTHPSIITR